MKRMAGRKYASILIVLPLVFTTATAALGAAMSAVSTDARLAKLQVELDHARAEQRRWQKVINIQEDLTRHPHKFSSLAEDAAHELEASGTDLVIEGVTGGISGSLTMRASWADAKTARQLKLLAAGVDALSADLIKDHIANGDAKDRKPSEQNSRAIEKLEATAKLAAEAVTDPQIKEAFTAATAMHVAALQFL